MAFERPTLQEIIERQQADVESRLLGTTPRLRRSVLFALVRALAGAVHGVYGYVAYLARALHPGTTTAEYLENWAGVWGVTRLAATPASGTVTFAGITGAVIPAGTLIQRADGVQYTTDAEGVISSGVADVAVTASTAGQETNADAGAGLSLVSPVADVASAPLVADGGLVGGADEESDESLRERWHARVRQRAEGGTVEDYEAWAREVAGVTRAWAFRRWLGLGTVGVFFVRDDDASPIPDAAEVQAVRDYIVPRIPGDMDDSNLYVLAPVAHTVDIVVSLSPNTSAVQAAVTAELEDLFRRKAAVEDGEGSGVVLLSQIREAISLAEGEEDHAIDLVADIAPARGEIAVLGTLTFGAL